MQSFQLVKRVSYLQIILFANVAKNIILQKLQCLLNVLLSWDFPLILESLSTYPLYYTVYWTVKWIWKQYYVFCAIYRSKHTFTKNKTMWKILIFQ